MTSRRWGAGMRRRRVEGAMAVPPVGGEGAVSRLPGMGVDFAGAGPARRSRRRGTRGAARAARAPRGRGLDELGGPVADGLVVFVLAERLVDGPPRHRARDVARKAGASIESL